MIINTKELYFDGLLRVEHRSYYATCGGNLINLRRAEFLTVSKLSQNPDRFITGKEIWQYVWQTQKPFNQESLKVYIYHLRRKLEPHGIRIETMVNVGYKLVTIQHIRND